MSLPLDIVQGLSGMHGCNLSHSRDAALSCFYVLTRGILLESLLDTFR